MREKLKSFPNSSQSTGVLTCHVEDVSFHAVMHVGVLLCLAVNAPVTALTVSLSKGVSLRSSLKVHPLGWG